MTIFPNILNSLKKEDALDICVFGGGIIPDEDITELKKIGVQEIFTPGTSLDEISKWVKNLRDPKI
jgi:methylmalonyl-CoA mutase C-terminal domain/subunit